jgi:hypothetical protein
VVAHLVAQINGLTDYGKSTRNLSSSALAVRRALLDATEPDTLLFDTLPAVFELPSVPVAGRRRSVGGYEHVDRLANGLEAVLHELQTIHARLLDEIEGELAVATRADVDTLRIDLAERARRLTGKVLDMRLRSMLASLADTQKDREGWLEYVAMTVGGPAASWDDDGRLRFLSSIRELGGTLRRIEAINFERLADDGEPFDARRWTVTASDGSERARVVAVDDRARLRLGERLKKLVDDLTEETGSRAAAVDTILAGLDEEWFSDDTDELSHPRSTVAGKHPDQATKARSS